MLYLGRLAAIVDFGAIDDDEVLLPDTQGEHFTGTGTLTTKGGVGILPVLVMVVGSCLTGGMRREEDGTLECNIDFNVGDATAAAAVAAEGIVEAVIFERSAFEMFAVELKRESFASKELLLLQGKGWPTLSSRLNLFREMGKLGLDFVDLRLL